MKAEEYIQHHHYPKYDLWYVVPRCLELQEWEKWDEYIKKTFPFQYFVREQIPTFCWYSIKHEWNTFVSRVKHFFKPCHPIIRKSIPRYDWMDLSDLIVDINFAIILQFKEEMDQGLVDWDWSEPHKQFKNWIESSVQWIKHDRVALDKQLHQSYPEFDKKGTYEELYGEVNRIEKLIEDTDKTIMKQMIDYKGYFWT
jgi:hypothetical protein